MTKHDERNTWRYKLEYKAAGKKHTQTWPVGMVDDAEVFGAALTKIAAIWSQLQPACASDLAFTELKLYPKGSNTGSIEALPAVLADANGGIALWTARDACENISFTAGGDDGSQTRQHFYGVVVVGQDGGSDDFRYTVGDATAIDNAISLVTNSVNFTTRSGSTARYRMYANAGHNAWWQRKVRGDA